MKVRKQEELEVEKVNTDKHWEFMFQGIGTLVVRKFFPEGGMVLPSLIIQRSRGRLSKS